jgi:hypothetical protein
LKKIFEDIGKSPKDAVAQSTTTQQNGPALSNGTSHQNATSSHHVTKFPNATTVELESTTQHITITQEGSEDLEHTSGAEGTLQKYGPVPKSTLNRANLVVEGIELRRDDLQDLEDNTRDISDQVGVPDTSFL